MTLSEFASAVGLIFGTVGMVLGILNYLRDRHRVDITLQWDLEVTPGTEYDSSKKWGAIRVTNVGRRATYISHVALKLPKGYDHSHLVIMGGIRGKKLSEGDPTEVFVVTQEGMEAYAKDWRRIVAQVTDSTGRNWLSKRLRKNEQPSWATSGA